MLSVCPVHVRSDHHTLPGHTELAPVRWSAGSAHSPPSSPWRQFQHLHDDNDNHYDDDDDDDDDEEEEEEEVEDDNEDDDGIDDGEDDEDENEIET